MKLVLSWFWVCLWIFLAEYRAPAEPTQGWLGPTGPYVFVEAESFRIQGAGWNVVDDPPVMFRPDSASNLKLLSGASADDGKAVQKMEVPADGSYRLWARFTQWPKPEPRWRAPFRVTIAQNDKQVFDQAFGETLVGEPKPDPVYYPDFVWVPATVSLAKGAAEITLSKLGAANVQGNLRQVDCLLLTTDTGYKPDHRDFGPQTYVRVRLHSAAPKRVYFYSFLDHDRTVWYHNLSLDKSGCHEGQVVAADKDYLSEGDATPWMEFSRLFYEGTQTAFWLHATITYGQRHAEASDYSVDFATAPDETKIVRTLRRTGPGDGMQIVAPSDLLGTHRPKADREYAEETAAFMAKLEPVKFGRVPKLFPTMLGLGVNEHNNTPGTRQLETKALQLMGINGLARRLDDQDLGDGLRFGVEGGAIWFMGPGIFNEPQVDKIDASLKASAESLNKEGHADCITINMLMDESGAIDLETMAKSEKSQQAFREWLRGQTYKPEDLGASSWDAVRLAEKRDEPPPLRYLLSQRFRAWSVVDFFRIATEIEHKYYPAHILTTQNYSDGAVYVANFFMQGNDYYVWFKNKALDAAWSEDWTNSGSTRQLCGWNVALMRSATKYYHQLIGMYDITSFGRAPLEVKLKACSDIAQGAKNLHFYSYMPRYENHEHGWYQKWDMYPAVAEICHEIGAAEDVLMDAMPVKAQTAILYSIPSDIWDVGVDNTQGMERMHAYLALRHGQIPVDVLSDDDVCENYLKGYRVAYLFGEQLDSRVVAPIVDWVQRGGTLVLSPGAGSKDELDKSSDALDKALRIERQPLQTLQHFYGAGSQIAAALASKGKVTLLDDKGNATGSADLFACQQQFGEMKGAKVLARFADGHAAALSVPTGRGRVVLCGFMPALAYIHSAYNKMWNTETKNDLVEPMESVGKALALAAHLPAPPKIKRLEYFPMPFEFNAALRDAMLAPTRLARIEKPVEANVAQVEATLMEGKQGWVVPLANYTGSPLKELKLTIRPGRSSGRVYSARRGTLVEKPARQITVTIPLESTDFVYAAWKER